MMSRKKEKAAAQKKETTRQLIGINDISDYGLKTSHGMLAFFSVKPTNLSVQPPEAVGRVRAFGSGSVGAFDEIAYYYRYRT